jgi:hypothetical protein
MRVRSAAWVLWLAAAAACDPEQAGPAGRPCSADAECAGLLCQAEANHAPTDLAAWPLQCAQRANGAKPGSPCSGTSDCDHGVCLLAGACAAPCASDTQCSAEQHCSAVYARSSPDTFATLHACVARVDLPADVRVHTNSLARALGAGVTTIDLQPAAAPTLFVLEHLGDTTWPMPDPTSRCRPPLCARKLSTRDPAAHVLFDLEALPEQGPDNPVASGSYVNPLTVLLPNGPRSELSAQGYVLELEAKRAGDLRITQLQREAHSQRLDLNLYYVGAAELTAAAYRGNELLRAALEEVDRIFATADIFIGEVRQIEVRGALLERGTPLPAAAASPGFRRLRSQYQVLPQLPELFKLSAGAANAALDVFFVADIDAGGADIGGIAGGTPIAFGMHGTPGSGIVIAADMFLAAGDAAKLARTIAHELGHALGLFHTTEVDGSVFDPLPDTPICPRQRDLNRDGLLDATECDGFGADNLMFPTSDAAQTRLTADQVDVLQRAFILQ